MGAAVATRSLIESLRELRTRFGPPARRARLELLARARRCRVTSARDARDLHALLLFARAWPDSAAVRRAADAAFAQLGATVGADRRLAARLSNSGIAGTVVEAPFSIDLMDWLLARFPGDVELAWEHESAGEALDDMLRLIVPTAERDGLLDQRITTQAWLRLARGASGGSDLQWLVEHFRALHVAPELLDYLIESLGVSVSWRAGRAAADPRLPARRLFTHDGPLQRGADVERLAARALPEPLRPPPQPVIDAARAALATRQRETDPVTWADPREVTLFCLERGIDLVLLGMQPARRLPLESFFGYLAAKNGIPVAYGGGWIFGDRGEIGISVFDPFRGGESAYLLGQVLRVYHRHYGVRRFLVDPFQFGAGNRDGVASGAYWFYDRLGFRPVEPALAALADQERARMAREPSYRSPPRVLARLAGGKLHRRIGGDGGGAEVPDPVEVGLAITREIGARFAGDRHAAVRWAGRRARDLLGVEPAALRGWPAARRAAFGRLGLLAALLPGVEAWPAKDRRAFVALLRAKGGPRERDYVLRVQQHGRFRGAMRELVEPREPRTTAPPDGCAVRAATAPSPARRPPGRSPAR